MAAITMKLATPLLSALLSMTLLGCDSGEDSTDGGPAPVLRVEADVTEVMPGDTITLTIEVENFTLSGEHDHAHLEQDFDPPLTDAPGDPLAAEADTYDGPREGHVHVYLDDLMTNPLAMLTTSTGEVVIDAEAGAHTLLCRLHSSDHKIIEPQIIEEIDISVLAP